MTEEIQYHAIRTNTGHYILIFAQYDVKLFSFNHTHLITFYLDTINIRYKLLGIWTGSEKRYIVAHNMIFLYKRCCSKTRNIFYSLKKIFFWAEVSTTLCLHSRQI